VRHAGTEQRTPRDTMKQTSSVEIELDCKRVSTLFGTPENESDWQASFISREHLEGTPGQPGARALLKHMLGSNEVSITETIVERDLPDRCRVQYEMRWMSIDAVSHFEGLSNGRTRWTMHTRFACKGFMKFIAMIMPGVFRKTNLRVMAAFKVYAERKKQ